MKDFSENFKDEIHKENSKMNNLKQLHTNVDESCEKKYYELDQTLESKKNGLKKHKNNSELDIEVIGDSFENIENSDGSYENITEEQALKKYKFSNVKYDKALEIFLNCFKTNVVNINFDKAVCLSKSIVNSIVSQSIDTFPKEVRSKSHNLKENSKLCTNVYYRLLSSEDFTRMTAEQMQSEELRSKDSESIKNSLLDSQIAKISADTDMFTCGKCKQKKCTYRQLQTRSCDEPMTTFVTCAVCGNRWRF